jgi:magnesium chelatase family protein
MTSAQAREQVARARELQTARLAPEGVGVNSRMDGRMLSMHVKLEDRGERLLREARATGMLSARGEHRVLRVARTIADLDASARVRACDLGAALALRPDASVAGNRAA